MTSADLATCSRSRQSPAVCWSVPAIRKQPLICCGWQGALWQVVCLAASFFIYLPFARSVDNELYENEQAAA